MIKKINQKDFKKLNILMSLTREISDIFKTIIFVDKIEDGFMII